MRKTKINKKKKPSKYKTMRKIVFQATS